MLVLAPLLLALQPVPPPTLRRGVPTTTLRAAAPAPPSFLSRCRATVPALHGVGCDTPTRHECPSGHAVQLACDSSPVALP